MNEFEMKDSKLPKVEHIHELLMKNADDIKSTLDRKNKDYGGASFEGYNGDFKMLILSNFIRIMDKVKRLENLIYKGNIALVKDESVKDTLRDIAGYGAIGMTIIDIENSMNEMKKNV